MSEEVTVVYIQDEELRQISNDQLNQLVIQNDILSEQQRQLNEIRQLNLVLILILGACLGSIIFRHLRK